jgi:enoyl-[acyl-carrier protein] reductase I
MDFLQLAGKRFLVFGVANRKSVAYHVGQVLTDAGATCVYVVRDEAIRESLSGLLAGHEIHVCDVEHDDQIARLRDQFSPRPLGEGQGEGRSSPRPLGEGQGEGRSSPRPLGEGQGEGVSSDKGRFHGLLHSIAFADYSAGPRPFHETPKADFLRSMDISCYSLVAICRALADLLDPDASVVTVSIPTTRMAAENYGHMGPVKAALDSSLCYLAKSFSRFSRVRFNAVAPAPLKTSSSAGVPGFVESYLYAEKVIPRKRAVQTEEAADVAAFLLSPRSSGINAQRIIVDAGMSINYFDNELIRGV